MSTILPQFPMLVGVSIAALLLAWLVGASLGRMAAGTVGPDAAPGARMIGRVAVLSAAILLLLRMLGVETEAVTATLARAVAGTIAAASVWWLGGIVGTRAGASGHAHVALVLSKVIRYGGVSLVVLLLADSLGFDLSALLATAGVLGVAVGFAAQTSLSNLIAGVFLITDRPFEIGHAIQVDGQEGVVESLTLLTTRLRTFDNLLVTIPNSRVLDATLVNLHAYPVRRLEFALRLPLSVNPDTARDAIEARLAEQPHLLLDPAPEVRFRDLLDNGITMLVRAWVPAGGLLDGRDQLVRATRAAVLDAGLPMVVPAYEVERKDDTEGRFIQPHEPET